VVGKYDTVLVPCWFCNRDVKYPRSRYKRGQPVFCSMKCNLKYVAREGEEQQRNAAIYGNHPAD
jgi:hypothetical protein